MPPARKGAEMSEYDEVEDVAQRIADAVGSQVFKPLHDTAEHQKVRDQFRALARDAIAVNQAEISALVTAHVKQS
jgi:hypothetical protein